MMGGAWLRAVAVTLLLALAAAGPARAQFDEPPARDTTLVADRISIEADNRLIAEGAVEVTNGITRLTAPRLVYDRTTEQLFIDGPIVIQEGEDTTILADAAEIDRGLERAILDSARLVLDQQVQIAADELTRVSGRYTRLSRAVASSCKVCEGGPPLWEIRSRRVIRDEEARQLYFDGAQFRIRGVPVMYLPRLRLPDPTLDRATGVLSPSLRTRSELGTGLRVPYFIRLGDHTDVTLTPYVSSETRTLEFRYREQFRRGQIEVEGAVSRDQIRPDDTRAYLFAEGRFLLPWEFTLRFNIEQVSDQSYLFDYGYSEADRLGSSVGIVRVRDDQFVTFDATLYETLRARELAIEEALPNQVLAWDVRQRIRRAPDFGSLWFHADGAAIVRESNVPGVGRDVMRFGAGLDWSGSRVFRNGMVAESEAALGIDLYDVSEDPRFGDTLSRSHAGASATLRWPFERRGADGARHLLEPLLQVAWSDAGGDAVPNEDSTVVEFDEGNLLALSRFPGADVVEEGTRLNFGAAWTRRDPDGWSMGATVGRVFRFSSRPEFGPETGLSGRASDWLVALHYRLDDRLWVMSRTLLDDNLDFSRSETRVDWTGERGSLSGTHLWRRADRIENRLTDLSELTLDGTLHLTRDWSADAEWRYDASANETTRAGFGLTFENECVAVGLSLSRRFTSSRNVRPATEIDLRLSLTGFGNGGSKRRARPVCRG